MSYRKHQHDPHYVSYTIRPASISRRAICITVSQVKDAAGRWLLPTITISDAIPQTTEDVVFMHSIAEALLLACCEFMEMMDYIE